METSPLVIAPTSVRLTLVFKCGVVFHDVTLFVIYLFILIISSWNYRGSSGINIFSNSFDSATCFLACILDKGVLLWDTDPYSKSYGIMVAYYMFYLARIISLLDTFIYILQKKIIYTPRVVNGVFNGIAPICVWLMAHFSNIPGHDLELVLYALTNCMVYLYYFLVTAGNHHT